MKPSKSLVMAFGIAAAAVAALAVLFLVFFERVEVEVRTGLSQEARRNHLLAAERLFQRLGVETRSFQGPIELPSEGYVLVLSPPEHDANRDWHEELFDWVRRGGHLILGFRGGPGSSEVLEPLGVTPLDVHAFGARAPLRLPVTEGGQAYEVEMSRSPVLGAGEAAAPEFVAGAESNGAALLRYRLGEGRVTVLADPSFLDNENLGLYQHASFAWALVTTPSPPTGVWLVYEDSDALSGRATGAPRGPDLLRWFAERGWTAALGLVLWLAAWLWYRGSRFGPLLPAPVPERRSLSEHLLASGNFLFRHGEGGALVAAVRRAVLGQAARKHPAWWQLAAPPPAGKPASASREQIEYLAAVADLPRGAVARALEEPVGDDAMELTRTVVVLEEIRRSL